MFKDPSDRNQHSDGLRAFFDPYQFPAPAEPLTMVFLPVLSEHARPNNFRPAPRSLLPGIAQEIFDERGDYENDDDPDGDAHHLFLMESNQPLGGGGAALALRQFS